MAKHLRALAVLIEDPDPIPAPTQRLIITYSSSSRRSDTPFWLPRESSTNVARHKCRQTIHKYKIKVNLKILMLIG